MTINLSQDLESSILSLVRDGRFGSVDEAMAEAARLLIRQRSTAKNPLTPAEFDQLLLNRGLMSNLPDTASDYDDPDDQPITTASGTSLETVIREPPLRWHLLLRYQCSRQTPCDRRPARPGSVPCSEPMQATGSISPVSRRRSCFAIASMAVDLSGA